ncbi:glutathione synthase/RimK-type ligase-like ATP-grasp enzyme [Laceyella sacchari]|uniref:YheC/YheD family endospore coat-associated protein n=1 Tax=Laceyella sacchari TaxID=37482 RepID=UPI00104D3D21|nr:YheC/YheD family protein [Laceyella sacchari]TCW40831.1 glutathione synthase/RimK-type ligase-like ATP-grasp enzyme [Laceyella sacchari]
MGLAKVQIQILPNQQFPEHINIMMSDQLAKKLNIHTDMLWVSFGSSVTTGVIGRLRRANHKVIFISSYLANKLLLPAQPHTVVHFDSRSLRLRLAPLFGILISKIPQTDNDDQLFGPITRFLDECDAAAMNQGIRVAVVLADMIDPDRRGIKGWIKANNRWLAAALPLPDVIYNRITSRKIEEKESVQAKLARLKHQFHIPIFNERFLNKLEVYQILSKDERMHQYLPETYTYHTDKCREFLSRHPVVYLKPTNGSLGQGIIRVERSGGGQWLYQSATPNGTLSKTVPSKKELLHLLDKKIRKQPYIMQQGLNLVKLGRRQVDFRVLAQKNIQGKWRITSSVGRIANDQHIVSNLARGGTIRKTGELLNELPLATKPSINDIQHAALSIIHSFEEWVGGHYAELGIDLGIDTKGKIWLIEINSKPSKTDDTVINPSSQTRPSVARLIDYVQYLVLYRRHAHAPPSHAPHWTSRRRKHQ